MCSALREPAFRADMQALSREGVEVHELAMLRAIRPSADAAHVLALRKLLRRLRPDVVHTHSSKAGVLGRAASISTGIGARVHTPHTFAFLFGAMFGGASRALFRAIEKELARKTERFVAVSADEARTFEAAGFIARDKIRVVPNGIVPERWTTAEPLARAQLGLPEQVPCAAVVGLLNVAKGQDLALRALAESGLERLHLVVVGHGETAGSLESLARELGLRERVHFLGWRDDVQRILKSVDALLLPSRWEGMPYVVLEAMAAGRPIVATRVDGARAVLEEARCGELCEIDSVPALAAGLRALFAREPAQLRELGERGRRAVLEHYTAEHMVRGLRTVYEELA